MPMYLLQVALPIPEPQGFQAADNYKIQLTFDGAHALSFRHILTPTGESRMVSHTCSDMLSHAYPGR